MTKTSESMTPAERLRVHVSMPNGWCQGCWWEYHTHIRFPCGWRQGAERVVSPQPSRRAPLS
ncbi:MAG: hypothetical protein ACRDXX_03065 [Stackebrandtia sp.]